jgi:hypothetical protein
MQKIKLGPLYQYMGNATIFISSSTDQNEKFVCPLDILMFIQEYSDSFTGSELTVYKILKTSGITGYIAIRNSDCFELAPTKVI